MVRRINMLGSNFDDLTMEETVNLVEDYILKGKKLHLVGVNADKINQMSKDSNLKRIVNESDIINADGVSAVIASKVLGYNLKERVAGIDLMNSLLNLANEKGYSVFFLGAKKDVLESCIENTLNKFSDLKIADSNDGYFGKEEWSQIASKIIHSKAQIVFIGITSPLKEELIDYFLSLNIKTVFMGVGGSFDVISGRIKRAPEFVQKLKMEWFYRMCQEPKRLFKRYLVGNTIFVGKVVREWIKLKY